MAGSWNPWIFLKFLIFLLRLFFSSDHTVISQWPWTSVGIECIHTATKSLFVYHSGTPSIFSQLISPAGWLGRPAGVQQCGNEALSLYRAETRTRGSLTSAEPAQAVVRILDGFMLNNQHSEVIEPENMILILQYQSWLLMIMRIYNDDDIFVLAKHQVLVKMFPVQSSTVQNTSPCASPSWTRRSSR